MSIAGVSDALAALQSAVDDVLKYADAGELGGLSDEEFVAAAHEVEAIRRQLAAADQPVVAEVARRGLPAATASGTVAGYLAGLWRLARPRRTPGCGKRPRWRRAPR